MLKHLDRRNQVGHTGGIVAVKMSADKNPQDGYKPMSVVQTYVDKEIGTCKFSKDYPTSALNL